MKKVKRSEVEMRVAEAWKHPSGKREKMKRKRNNEEKSGKITGSDDMNVQGVHRNSSTLKN